MNAANQAIKAYAQINMETAVNCANPVQLIVALYDGAVDAIAGAKAQIAQKNYERKAKHISHAILIIDGLRRIIDHEKGGAIAANLGALYDYMKRRLIAANASNAVEVLAEVQELLTSLREAWAVLARSQAGVPTDAPPAQGAKAYAKA
ncbi:MAG: flagellar export chaperone FliS [Betaproteobacteria bacterium]|nr:flagellar export chaperone FliS [Betaproteobacteria bacterium]